MIAFPTTTPAFYRYLGLLLLLSLASLAAYEGPRPEYIKVDVVWIDQQGVEQLTNGQLWFGDMPHHEPGRPSYQGRPRGFGSTANMDGIKWFVPRQPGDIWLQHKGDPDRPHLFHLHDHYGDYAVDFVFDRIDIIRTNDGKLGKRIEEITKDLYDADKGKTEDTDLDDLSFDGEKIEDIDRVELDPNVAAERSLARTNRRTLDRRAAQKDRPSPVRLALEEDIGITSIPLAQVRKITFLKASGGIKRERYNGRFLQYSAMAKGDSGTVQVEAATFFGGPDKERFSIGEFLPDGSIMMGGSFWNIDFAEGDHAITVLGDDPPAGSYHVPMVDEDGKRIRRNRRWSHPRSAAVLVHYSDDLQQLKGIIRMPWGTGKPSRFSFEQDGSILLGGMCGPHFETWFKGLRNTNTYIDHGALEESKAPIKKNRYRELRGDAYLVKITPDRRVAWATKWQHVFGPPDTFVFPDGRTLVRCKDRVIFITAAGEPEPGPKLARESYTMDVDPKTGDMYFGGNDFTSTGLEPWRSPLAFKLNAQGEFVWTAYDWTGPMVGTDPFRLVSDSSISQISLGENGRLSFIGWSDGGNTVFTKQPYDMRKEVTSSGFCNSVWGATGGITVRIPNLVQMDAQTMEVYGRTQYLAYLPCSDLPVSTHCYHLKTMPNGDIAITGAAGMGLVETWDSWIPSWSVEYRSFEHVQAKSGTYFTLFRPGFGLPRMATRTPGVSGGQLAQQGDKLLLYGSAGSSNWTPEEADIARKRYWRRRGRYGCIIKNAVQPLNGGQHDAYVMLIDTQADPSFTGLPEWQWDSPAVLKARQKEQDKAKRKQRTAEKVFR